MDEINAYLSEVMDAMLHVDRAIIQDIIKAIEEVARNEGEIYLAGNGGSALTASHFSGDLEKTCHIKTRCLTNSPYLITAYSNDVSFKDLFVEQLEEFYQESLDILIAISGSGNSKNIVHVANWARKHGLLVIGLTGREGGDLWPQTDICIRVDSDHMEVIEDVHMAICHCIIEQLKADK